MKQALTVAAIAAICDVASVSRHNCTAPLNSSSFFNIGRYPSPQAQDPHQGKFSAPRLKLPDFPSPEGRHSLPLRTQFFWIINQQTLTGSSFPITRQALMSIGFVSSRWRCRAKLLTTWPQLVHSLSSWDRVALIVMMSPTPTHPTARPLSITTTYRARPLLALLISPNRYC